MPTKLQLLQPLAKSQLQHMVQKYEVPGEDLQQLLTTAGLNPDGRATWDWLCSALLT